MGEGAFEAELWVQLPDGSFYQRALSDTQVGNSRDGMGTRGHRCGVVTLSMGWWHRVWDGDNGYGAVAPSVGW